MIAKASATTRIQTYLYGYKFYTIFNATPRDIATHALIIHPVWRTKATALWDLAARRAQGRDSAIAAPRISRAYERLVLDNMSVDEAFAKLMTVQSVTEANAVGTKKVDMRTPESSDSESEEYKNATDPLAVLARAVVNEQVRKETERIFLRTVNEADGPSIEREIESEFDDEEREKCFDTLELVAASRSLDGATASLVDTFERVCNPTSALFASDSDLDLDALDSDASNFSAEDTELRALLRSIILYRRIFPSTLLSSSPSNADCSSRTGTGISISLTPMPSPPPSPSRGKNAKLHLALRRELDSRAFERSPGLEDARDYVVDMLTAEKLGRRAR